MYFNKHFSMYLKSSDLTVEWIYNSAKRIILDAIGTSMKYCLYSEANYFLYTIQQNGLNVLYVNMIKYTSACKHF